RVRLEFSTGSGVVAVVGGLRHATVSFPPHRTTFLRVRIAAVGPASGPLASGAAIADIGIPGLDPAEIIQVPSDLLVAAARIPGGKARLAEAPLTYLFQRARTGLIGQPDEEVRLARRFRTPGLASFGLTGIAVLATRASDD